MVNPASLSHELISSFRAALLGLTPSDSLEPALREQLLIRGILAVLQEDGSEEAVGALAQTVRACPIPAGKERALKTLQSLSLAANQHAIDSLYRLAVDEDHAIARVHLLENHLEASQPALSAALRLLAGEIPTPEPGLDWLTLLTDVFFTRTEAVQQKMLSAARRSGAENWAEIVAALRSPTPQTLSPLISAYTGFRPAERALLRSLLFERAKAGSRLCADQFCELFIRHEDDQVRQLALQHRIYPGSPIQRALFLFLAGNWQDYNAHDFNHTLISAAYETATPEIRKRILAISRESGFTSWLQDTHPGTSRNVRLLADLSSEDWKSTLQALQQKKQWEQLWRLALAAPPIHSAGIILSLIQGPWKAPQPETAEILPRLGYLAGQCLNRPIQLLPETTLPTGSAVLNLAVNADGSILAAGTRDGAIILWRAPFFTPLGSIQLGAIQGVRALAMDHPGSYLAAACGDQRIRIFNLRQKTPIKMLEGHQNLVRALVVHPDQRLLASGSFDGTVRLWRFPLGPQQALLQPGQGEIYDIAISPEGEFLISAGFDGRLMVYHLPDGSLVRQMVGHHSPINRLAIFPRLPFVAAYESDGNIKVWNYRSGRQVAGMALSRPENILTSLAVHPTEYLMLSGDTTGKLDFWQTTSGDHLDWVNISSGTDRITAALFLGSGDRLLVSDAAGILHLYSLDPLLLAVQPVELHPPAMLSVLESSLQKKPSNPAYRAWLAFTVELLRWRQRFDVELGAHPLIEAGEFDIQL